MGRLEHILYSSVLCHDSRASTVDGSLVHVRFACFTSLRVAIRDISSVVAAMEMATASVIISYDYVVAHGKRW